MNHMYLTLAFVVLTAMLIYSFFSNKLRGFNGTAPAEAIRLINRDNAVVLDVREENEFHSGHIVNAIHIPLSFLKSRISELEKHKDKPIIVGCRSGQRSATACGILKKHGFEKVFNLNGGVTAWQQDSLPLVKKK
ncbi:MAG: rhodanese-like domain-containing protein [Gammaproteobacteria bacterium]|nr:rhodanese-like domain-containing protein [Gammaproteobacteria bacterium]